MDQERIWTRRFFSLFVTNIAVFIVFYGLVAALPLYAVGLLNRTDEDAGLLMSVFLLSAIFVRPFSGKVLDVVGKRKMLWIGLIFYLICTVLYYFVHPFSLLLILRFFQGIWFSIITTAAVTIAADIVPPARRGAGLGYFNMSTNLAVVLGPLIALSIIQTYSFDILFIVLSVLMLIGGLFSLYAPADEEDEQTKMPFTISLGDLFEKAAIPAALIGSFIAFAYASVLSYLSIYAQEKNVLSFASTFFIVFAIVMLVTRPWTGKLFDEYGSKFVLIPGFISFMVGLILLAYIEGPMLFLISGGFIGFGYGAIVPSLQTLAIQTTSSKRSGYATATFFTFFDSGVAIGSYVLGIIAITFGYKNVYLLASLLTFIVFLFYVIFQRKKA